MRLTHIVRGFRSIGSLGLCAVVPAFGALSSCAVLPGTVRSVHTLYSLHAVSLPYNAVTYLTARSTVPWCLWITTGSTLGSLFSGLPFDPAHSMHTRCHDTWFTRSVRCVHDCRCTLVMRGCSLERFARGRCGISKCGSLLDVCGTPMARLTRVRRGILWTSSLNSCAVSCSFRFTRVMRGFVPIRCTPSMRGCLKRRFARLTRGVLGFGTRSPVPWCST